MMVQKIGSVFRPKLFFYLIRALIPRWNFFDHVNYQFELEFKISGSQTWEIVTFHQKKDIFGLFVNPKTNQDMALVNVIEHFAHDIQELVLNNPMLRFKEVQRLTSFKLLRSLIREELNQYEISNRTIQFKIVASNLEERKEIYISDWFNIGDPL